MENLFEVEVDKALQLNLLDMVREFYLLETGGYITQDLYINVSEGLNIELLERIVRFYCNIRFYLDKDFDKIIIIGLDKKVKEFVVWFIQFFYYLEAMELTERFQNHSHYKPTKEIKEIFKNNFASYKIDISKKRFVFASVTVEVK